MGKYKLTVVTTTYNQEKYIEQCIKSIISQKTDFKYKLLISDDNSTDNTKNIIKKYQQKYPDKIDVILREKNLGAMNNFIETLNLVHTKYVAFCDGDDFWTNDKKLQKQVDFLEKNKDYTICFHQTLIFFEDKSREDVLHPINLKSELTLEDLIKENYIPANSVVYKWKYKDSDSLKKEFPENIVPGDYFLHLIHAKLGKIHYIDEQMSCYRRQPSGMWYLSSQPDKQDLFYDIYGEKYLRFFKETEKILNLDKNTFKAQKDWIIKMSIVSYVKLRRTKKLKKLYNNDYSQNKQLFLDSASALSWKEKLYYFYHTNILLLIKKSIGFIKRKVREHF